MPSLWPLSVAVLTPQVTQHNTDEWYRCLLRWWYEVDFHVLLTWYVGMGSYLWHQFFYTACVLPTWYNEWTVYLYISHQIMIGHCRKDAYMLPWVINFVIFIVRVKFLPCKDSSVASSDYAFYNLIRWWKNQVRVFQWSQFVFFSNHWKESRGFGQL